jgi:uncharacterized membrane protein (DUF485 family)
MERFGHYPSILVAGSALWGEFRRRECTASGRSADMRLIGDFIFIVFFFILLIAWLIAWAAFHVAGGAIHLLLIVAVISLIAHFFRRRRTV